MDEPPTKEMTQLANQLVKPGFDRIQHEVRNCTDLQAIWSSQGNYGFQSTPQIHSGTTVNQLRFDPRYVQISSHEAAEILGITTEEFHNRRRSDKRCPTGFIESGQWMEPMRLRLSDIYAYSEHIMASSTPASTEPNISVD